MQKPGKSPGFLFGSVVERGIHEGDMKSETNPRALARFLRAIIQGMSVQARDGASLARISQSKGCNGAANLRNCFCYKGLPDS